MSRSQYLINIDHLIDAVSTAMDAAADLDETLDWQRRQDCVAAANLLSQQAQVQAMMFVGEQIALLASKLDVR